MVETRAVTIKSIRATGRIKIPTMNIKVKIAKSNSINVVHSFYDFEG
jgi:hypothetical protein